MSIISSLVKKYLGELITNTNAEKLVDDGLNTIASFVAGTNNQVDDAIFAELEKDIDFHHVAQESVAWVRSMLNLDLATHKMFGPAIARPPKIFLALVRARLVTEVSRTKHISRDEARKQVGKADDNFILSHANENGIKSMAIGDGTILAWLIAHGPEILAFIMKLLPLILAL